MSGLIQVIYQVFCAFVVYLGVRNLLKADKLSTQLTYGIVLIPFIARALQLR